MIAAFLFLLQFLLLNSGSPTWTRTRDQQLTAKFLSCFNRYSARPHPSSIARIRQTSGRTGPAANRLPIYICKSFVAPLGVAWPHALRSTWQKQENQEAQPAQTAPLPVLNRMLPPILAGAVRRRDRMLRRRDHGTGMERVVEDPLNQQYKRALHLRLLKGVKH
jgi:hypothetical protein